MYQLNDKVALLTKHKKEAQITPVFAQLWSGEIEVYSAFDTDKLGNFDNSVTRKLPPNQCAIKKANLACKYTCLDQGLGSEGSFTGYAGIGNMNEEFLAFVDVSSSIEVVGVYRQLTMLAPIHATSESELEECLNQYPNEQGWMLVEKSNAAEQVVEKGLIGTNQIIDAARKKFPIDITPDFRAMMCPERQATIANAAENLLQRLQAPCPSCTSPGFVYDKVERGLPCELCGASTNQPIFSMAECKKCGHSEKKRVTEETASSFYCSICNP